MELDDDSDYDHILRYMMLERKMISDETKLDLIKRIIAENRELKAQNLVMMKHSFDLVCADVKVAGKRLKELIKIAFPGYHADKTEAENYLKNVLYVPEKDIEGIMECFWGSSTTTAKDFCLAVHANIYAGTIYERYVYNL